MKIYKVLDISTGSYIDCNSREEALHKTAELASAKWLEYTQDQPYSIVEINADGSEVWRNPMGEEIKSPEELREEMKSLLASRIPPTRVEVLP